jgi:ABC-type Na+ transport system ATPase subunit NatA
MKNALRWMNQFTQSPNGLLHAHADLSDDVQTVRDTIGVLASGTVFISGLAARQQAAIDAALENGATAEELAPLTSLQGELLAKKDEFAAAMVANS